MPCKARSNGIVSPQPIITELKAGVARDTRNCMEEAGSVTTAEKHLLTYEWVLKWYILTIGWKSGGNSDTRHSVDRP